jgi:hypothetical protein
MKISGHDPGAVLDRQLHDARMRTFHAREEELATLRKAMTERTGTFTVVHLYGPGGIGKSTLLHRFAEEARRAGRPVVVLRPAQDDVRWHPEGQAPPVVLIDELDRADQPAQWLRQTVLPTFPVGSLVVVVSRQAPPVAWRAELGWSDLLLPLRLGPFTPAESAALLRALHVPPARREGVLRACGGNPLALRVAAQTVANDPECTTEEDLRRELALSISPQLIGDYPSVAHRQALEVCAHAATTNENLLRAVLPGADAGALFAWLRDLPFISSGARGLHPSDVVRNVVAAELRWRDADQFAAMHERVLGHLRTRARAAAGDAVAPAVADVIFAQRAERTAEPGCADLDDLDVREDRYQTADRTELCELARRTEGAGSARLVAFWLDRQPAAFHVYRRRGEPRIVAFVGQLDLVRPSAEELRADPVVAAAWSRTHGSAALRPGERLSLVRFLVDGVAQPRPAELTTLLRTRVATPLICDDRVAWSVVAGPEHEGWPDRIARSHSRDDARPIVVDDRSYQLFSVHRGPSGMDDHPPARREHFTTWNRTDFEQEVRRTLRSWRRPDQFADSALLRSRMVGDAGYDDVVTALRQTFTAALDTLGSDPRQAKYHRVLVTTFLQGAPTQEAAAERLSLPFSTFRRHLNRGLDELCALLWKAENQGLRLLTAAVPRH